MLFICVAISVASHFSSFSGANNRHLNLSKSLWLSNMFDIVYFINGKQSYYSIENPRLRMLQPRMFYYIMTPTWKRGLHLDLFPSSQDWCDTWSWYWAMAASPASWQAEDPGVGMGNKHFYPGHRAAQPWCTVDVLTKHICTSWHFQLNISWS